MSSLMWQVQRQFLQWMLLLLILLSLDACQNTSPHPDINLPIPIFIAPRTITTTLHNKNKTLLKSTKIHPNAKIYQARGVASWYGHRFNRHRTSSGERYNMYGLTAAHRTLPLFSFAQVTNLANGRKVLVRINDRGPFYKHRLIDVSYGAARQLGLHRQGTAPVEIITVSPTTAELKAWQQASTQAATELARHKVRSRKHLLHHKTLLAQSKTSATHRKVGNARYASVS